MSGSIDRVKPPYARIVDALRTQIHSGEIAPDDRVPSTREIARQWGVATATATKVLAALRQEGLVEPVPGIGTVVVRSESEPSRTTTARDHGEHRTSPRVRRHPGGTDSVITRDAIVRAAISVADAEGIEDFTMRKVAGELQVSTMALYRHVDHRTDLVSGMIEAVYRESHLPELSGADWRSSLRSVALWEWGIFRRHPWVVPLASSTRAFITPSVMASTEEALKGLIDEGCSADRALEIVTMVLGFTGGMATQALLMETPDEPSLSGRGGWWEDRAPQLAGRAGEAGLSHVFDVTRIPNFDDIFSTGLEGLLDGISPLVGADE